MPAFISLSIFSFSAGISLCPVWYAGIVGYFCGSFSLILWLIFLMGGSVLGTVSTNTLGYSLTKSGFPSVFAIADLIWVDFPIQLILTFSFGKYIEFCSQSLVASC